MKNVLLALLSLLFAVNCINCTRLTMIEAAVAMTPPPPGDVRARAVFGRVGVSRPFRDAMYALRVPDFSEVIPRLQKVAWDEPRGPTAKPSPFRCDRTGYMFLTRRDGSRLMVFRPNDIPESMRGIVLISPGAFSGPWTDSVRELIVALGDAGLDVIVYIGALHDRELVLRRAGLGDARLHGLGVSEAADLEDIGRVVAVECGGTKPSIVGLSLGGLATALVGSADVFRHVVVVGAPTGGLRPVLDLFRARIEQPEVMPAWEGLLSSGPAEVTAAKMFGVALALTMRAARIDPDAQPNARVFQDYLARVEAAIGVSPENVLTERRITQGLIHLRATAIFFDSDFIATPKMAAAAQAAGACVLRLQGGHLSPSDPVAYERTVRHALGVP